MPVIKIPQLLIIAGNGRNSGKTTLACRLIHKFSRFLPVVSMKISPHDHQASYSEIPEKNSPWFTIVEEKNRLSSKDSSRMLAAGARRSFFISAADESLELVIPTIEELAREGNYIVCESGGLRNIAEPGLFLVAGKMDKETQAREQIKPGLKKLLVFEHALMAFDGHDFDPGVDNIIVNEGTWKIRNSLP